MFMDLCLFLLLLYRMQLGNHYMKTPKSWRLVRSVDLSLLWYHEIKVDFMVLLYNYYYKISYILHEFQLLVDFGSWNHWCFSSTFSFTPLVSIPFVLLLFDVKNNSYVAKYHWHVLIVYINQSSKLVHWP